MGQLIYNNAIREQRKSSRIPLVGLVKPMIQTWLLVTVFYFMYVVLGIRSSPVRGDMILFLLTGILGYINHLKGFTTAAGAPSPNSPLMQHQPMTSFLALISSTFSALYTIAVSTIITLFVYDQFIAELHIHDTFNFAMTMALCCLSGSCVGLVFYSAMPFSPGTVTFAKTAYQRVSMVASGKMLLANLVPSTLLPFFSWHPLFHINDQGRGFAFNNYFPHKTSLSYPLIFMLVCFVIGMLLLFVARQRASLSWGARKI